MKTILGKHLGGAFLIAVVVLIVGCGGNTSTNTGTTKAKTTPFLVTDPHLDDEDCKKEIEEEVLKVKGVDYIECDYTKKIASVYPKEGATVSAKELWEAFGRTKEDKCTKIDGPTGVFTALPDK
jgi:hypothetical protein